MPSITAKEFLSAIWGEREGVAELTVIAQSGPLDSHGFEYPKDLDALIDAAHRYNQNANVYYGVCLRKPGTKMGRVEGKVRRGKESDAASSMCVWIDLDFEEASHKSGNTLSEAEARRRTMEFPLQPSIAVRTGGGAHLYWLLREAATEEEELRHLKATNTALKKHFGVDAVQDLARILRIPETTNIKYAPPRPVTVSLWEPGRRYSLSDFDFLPQETESTSEKPADAPSAPSDDLVERVEKLLAPIWIKSYRHRLTLYIAGVFAHAGFPKEMADRLITAVTAAAKDEEAPNRLIDVATTYERFAQDKKVAGAASLEKMIREEFPVGAMADAAKEIYGKVLKAVRKASPKRKGRANFKLEGLIKFDSRPAIWKAVIRLEDGDLVNVDADTKTFLNFKLFKEKIFEETNRLLQCGQLEWDHTVQSVPPEIRPAPEEASPLGAAEIALAEFLEEKKENPDIGALRAMPGYDEHEVFFRAEALRAVFKERGIKIEDHQLCKFLRAGGWESIPRRFGSRVSRVWSRKVESNGHAKPAPEQEAQGEFSF